MSENGSKPAVDWNEVYQVWAYRAGQNDHETARLTGIPRRSISYHHVSEGWADRYIHDHFGLSEQDVTLARIDMRALLKEGMRDRLRSVVLDKEPVLDAKGNPVLDADGEPVMRWRSSDRDAINAMRIVAQYSLDPARDRDIATPLPAQFRVLPSTDDPLSLQEEAIRILETNAQSANTRIKRGQRR
jgi:hypothetical protein